MIAYYVPFIRFEFKIKLHSLFCVIKIINSDSTASSSFFISTENHESFPETSVLILISFYLQLDALCNRDCDLLHVHSVRNVINLNVICMKLRIQQAAGFFRICFSRRQKIVKITGDRTQLTGH